MRKIALFAALVAVFFASCDKKDNIKERYLASATNEVALYTLDDKGRICDAPSIVRGRKVRANLGKAVKVEKTYFIPVEVARKQ